MSGGTTKVPPEAPPHYRYWRYEPNPASSDSHCTAISHSEYPAPIPTATEGEARIKDVAAFADESCRNWVRAWREGNTFLDTRVMGPTVYERRFSIEEVRPVNEGFALVLVQHRNDQRDHPIYMIYDIGDHSCRETEYAAEAWLSWPETPPELNR